MKNKMLMILVVLVSFVNANAIAKDISAETKINLNSIEKWKVEIKDAFDKAEKEVYKEKGPDNIIKPDEDPKKCPCKGTGKIIQGDGHITPCPYHGKQTSKGFTCKCDSRCKCEECECPKTEIK